MATKIRVGMVGVTPDRGFSSIAHMPALQALPDFEVVALCTTRQETADAAARHMAFLSPSPMPWSSPSTPTSTWSLSASRCRITSRR